MEATRLNQLLGGSWSFAPNPSQMNGLHITSATSFHKSFHYVTLLRHSAPLPGPSKRAHMQTSPKCQLTAGARAPANNIRYAVRFRYCTPAHALDSLVRVSRRVRLNSLVEHKRFAKSKQEDGLGYDPSACPHHISQQNAKPNQAARGTGGSIPDRDCKPQSYHKERFNLLPFQQLHALLTLFPKSFSPFIHGTCSLLVSST